MKRTKFLEKIEDYVENDLLAKGISEYVTIWSSKKNFIMEIDNKNIKFKYPLKEEYERFENEPETTLKQVYRDSVRTRILTDLNPHFVKNLLAETDIDEDKPLISGKFDIPTKKMLDEALKDKTFMSSIPMKKCWVKPENNSQVSETEGAYYNLSSGGTKTCPANEKNPVLICFQTNRKNQNEVENSLKRHDIPFTIVPNEEKDHPKRITYLVDLHFNDEPLSLNKTTPYRFTSLCMKTNDRAGVILSDIKDLMRTNSNNVINKNEIPEDYSKENITNIIQNMAYALDGMELHSQLLFNCNATDEANHVYVYTNSDGYIRIWNNEASFNPYNTYSIQELFDSFEEEVSSYYIYDDRFIESDPVNMRVLPATQEIPEEYAYNKPLNQIVTVDIVPNTTNQLMLTKEQADTLFPDIRKRFCTGKIMDLKELNDSIKDTSGIMVYQENNVLPEGNNIKIYNLPVALSQSNIKKGYILPLADKAYVFTPQFYETNFSTEEMKNIMQTLNNNAEDCSLGYLENNKLLRYSDSELTVVSADKVLESEIIER